MKLTIVTINYNDYKGLSETIRSVENILLNSNDIEYIIVDGGSDDSSKDLILLKEKIITNWVSEKDKGIYDAMNKGVSMSNGDYICFLNSGDTLCESLPMKSMLEILAEKKYDIVYGKHLTKTKDEITQSKLVELKKIEYGMVFNHQASVVKKSLLVENPFNCNFLSADYDLFLKLYYQGKSFLFFDENVCVFDANGISSKNKIRIYREWAKISLSHGFSIKKAFVFGLMFLSYYVKSTAMMFLQSK